MSSKSQFHCNEDVILSIRGVIKSMQVLFQDVEKNIEMYAKKDNS